MFIEIIIIVVNNIFLYKYCSELSVQFSIELSETKKKTFEIEFKLVLVWPRFLFSQENLSDSDSYVYLASVEGLAALAADHAETVVDTLTQHFISDTRQLECRLKLGEVLMKVARHLGM